MEISRYPVSPVFKTPLFFDNTFIRIFCEKANSQMKVDRTVMTQILNVFILCWSIRTLNLFRLNIRADINNKKL